MKLTKQVKTLDDKIKANKAQYDLDREAAKISALSSGELENQPYAGYYVMLLFKLTLIMHRQPGIRTSPKK